MPAGSAAREQTSNAANSTGQQGGHIQQAQGRLNLTMQRKTAHAEFIPGFLLSSGETHLLLFMNHSTRLTLKDK